MPETSTSLLTRPIPKSGELLPVIGLGTWQVFDLSPHHARWAAATETLRQFAQAGGTLVDSSPMYGNAEAAIGQMSAELGLKDRLFLATKVWITGREQGIRQMEESMAKLRTSRIDLMQVHNLVDVHTHLSTLRAWKDAGRLRYIGITHYQNSAHKELERLLHSEDDLDFLQVNYSLVEREAEQRLLPLAAEKGVAALINRPFDLGKLFGRLKGRPLPPWAAEFGCRTWAEFLLKYILGHPAVTCVIPATGNPEHLAQNMAALRGPLPDESTRRQMVEYVKHL